MKYFFPSGKSLTFVTPVNEMIAAYLERVNESEVIESDIVVVVLDLTESLLVILHKCVDLTVLPFLDLMDLCLASQLQIFI